MANEVTWKFGLSATKAGTTIGNATQTKTQSMESTSTAMSSILQSISTSKTALDLGSVNTAKEYGLCLRNTESANYIRIYCSIDTYTAEVARIRAGEALVLRSPANVLWQAQSSAGSSWLEVNSVELGDPAL